VRYFIIAGEASGDLHGSNLIKGLHKTDPDAEIVCWGGDKMEDAGSRLLMHYRELAIMGFWEVITRIGKILHKLNLCKEQISDFSPDLVILIDYPGFNLRIARYLYEKEISAYYYISPKVWAWKKSRIKKIKQYINRMYVIFPFEQAFFEEHDFVVHYFGNPLVEVVEEGISSADGQKEFISRYQLEDKPVISLLPGSRMQEIKKILPLMARVSDFYPDYQFVMAGISTIDRHVYENIIQDRDIKLIFNDTYSILANSQAALVTSGTATLETAIAGIPQVVCYKTSILSYLIARRLVNIRFISLVNLIMDKEIVRELVQDNMNEKEILGELNSLLPGGWKREIMLGNYRELKKMLSGRGASSRIAVDMYHSLKLVSDVN